VIKSPALDTCTPLKWGGFRFSTVHGSSVIFRGSLLIFTILTLPMAAHLAYCVFSVCLSTSCFSTFGRWML